MKERSKSDILRVLGVGVILLVVLLVVSYIYLNKLAADEASTTQCNNSDFGWECEYPGLLLRLIDSPLSQKCEADGGRWRIGPVIGVYCDFPLRDSDKECNDSSQCEGLCAVQTTDPSRDLGCGGHCSGRCSKYPRRSCDPSDEGLIEIVNGTQGKLVMTQDGKAQYRKTVC